MPNSVKPQLVSYWEDIIIIIIANNLISIWRFHISASFVFNHVLRLQYSYSLISSSIFFSLIVHYLPITNAHIIHLSFYHLKALVFVLLSLISWYLALHLLNWCLRELIYISVHWTYFWTCRRIFIIKQHF